MSLFQEFSPSTAKEWQAQIEKDLRGLPFESLISSTLGEIPRNPFYFNESKNYSPAFCHRDWDILERVYSEESSANSLLLSALNSGASGILIDLKGQLDLQNLLKGIQCNFINSQFRIVDYHPTLLQDLNNYFSSFSPTQTWNASISFDILAHLLESGDWFFNAEDDKNIFSDSVKLFSEFKGIRSIVIEGNVFQNSGANVYTELGSILSQAHFYLHFLLEKGMDKNKIADCFQFNLSIGNDFFLEISKLRALQRLWSFVLSKYGIISETYISATTTLMDKGSKDSYTNLLRSSTQGMSAILGGARSLLIHPFDSSFSTPSEFSRRMSRNQQLIFKEEAYLNKVSDMAAGSYYLESLTNEVETRSYSFFQEIESRGGFLNAVTKGFIQQKISDQARELVEKYHSEKQVMVGLNKFKPSSEEVKGCKTQPIYQRGKLNFTPIDYLLLENEIKFSS